MSHSSSSDKVEPNLVPLLDLVLQLVMFFMLVANFTMEQVNQDIVLPDASQAKLPDKTETDVLYLNLDAKGHLMVPGHEEPKTTIPEIRTYLQGEFREREAIAKTRGEKGSGSTVIIIRGHRDSDFAPVFNILREAKQAGFKKWQLRAKILRKE